MRVVLAHHVADDARGFLVGTPSRVSLLIHPVQDAAMDRLQAVANVGKRAADDDRHRVVEIRLAHLVFDVDRQLLIVEVCVIEFGHFGVRRLAAAFGVERQSGGNPSHSI